MLVAYAACGCRLAVLLEADEVDEETAAFREHYSEPGALIVAEEHESIGPARCDLHYRPVDPPVPDPVVEAAHAVLDRVFEAHIRRVVAKEQAFAARRESLLGLVREIEDALAVSGERIPEGESA